MSGVQPQALVYIFPPRRKMPESDVEHHHVPGYFQGRRVPESQLRTLVYNIGRVPESDARGVAWSMYSKLYTRGRSEPVALLLRHLVWPLGKTTRVSNYLSPLPPQPPNNQYGY